MATYYVKPSTGSNGNAGTSVGAAWQTTQFAADSAVAGDIVYLCNEATESVGTQIDFDTNLGTSTNRIYFIGADSSGNPLTEGSYYTLQASSSITSVLSFATGTGHVEFRNIKIDGNSNSTYCVNHVNDLSAIRFIDSELLDATSHGMNIRGAAGSYEDLHLAERCLIHDNGGWGIFKAASNRGPINVFGGEIYSNGGGGAYIDRNVRWAGVLIYGNTGRQLELGSSSDGFVLEFCTLDGGTECLWFDSASVNNRIQNNVFSNATNYGVFENAATSDTLQFWYFNCFYNNGTNWANNGSESGTTPPETKPHQVRGNFVGDPKYTNTGSGDYRPRAGSALIDASWSTTTIGALSVNASVEVVSMI